MRGLSFFILRSAPQTRIRAPLRAGGDFNVLDAGPAVAALDEGDKGVEGGTLALGLQRDAAVPVVGDPAGQAQMQGRGAGIIAEAYALHCAGEAPAAADGAHASMPVTV